MLIAVGNGDYKRPAAWSGPQRGWIVAALSSSGGAGFFSGFFLARAWSIVAGDALRDGWATVREKGRMGGMGGMGHGGMGQMGPSQSQSSRHRLTPRARARAASAVAKTGSFQSRCASSIRTENPNHFRNQGTQWTGRVGGPAQVRRAVKRRLAGDPRARVRRSARGLVEAAIEETCEPGPHGTRRGVDAPGSGDLMQ